MVGRWQRAAARGIPLVATLAVLGGATAYGFSSTEAPVRPIDVEVTAGGPGSSSLDGTWEVAEAPARTTLVTVADATGPSVDLFSAPDVPVADDPVMENPTHEGLPVVFVVLEERGPWLHVRVSRRPNGMTAWVQRDQVSLRQLDRLVLIEVGARRVTVYQGDEVLLQEPVAVGADRTPTPIGTFFVDGMVALTNTTGPYGTHQVSVAGFSDVLQSFGGGVGQIAMHGTNQPQLIGQNVSNGCIRMTNEVIARMAVLAPLGTPVEIVP